MLVLPSQLATGEYIDIRLALPTEQDYIVVSKKQVEIPQIAGIDVEDTIWVKLSEEEIEKLKERDPDIINSGEINASKYSYIYVYCDVNSTNSPAPTSDMLKISYQTQ